MTRSRRSLPSSTRVQRSSTRRISRPSVTRRRKQGSSWAGDWFLVVGETLGAASVKLQKNPYHEGHERKTQRPRFASVLLTPGPPERGSHLPDEIHRISTALGKNLRGSLYSQRTGNAILTYYYYLKLCIAIGGFPRTPASGGPFPTPEKQGLRNSRSATK